MKKNHQFNVCLAGNNCLGTNRKNNEQKLPKNHVVANKMKATVLYYSHKGKTAFFRTRDSHVSLVKRVERQPECHF